MQSEDIEVLLTRMLARATTLGRELSEAADVQPQLQPLADAMGELERALARIIARQLGLVAEPAPRAISRDQLNAEDLARWSPAWRGLLRGKPS
jgi:hypothetical protein